MGNSIKAEIEGSSTHVCVIGNLLGRNPGYVTTQGQILADLLAETGLRVTSASPKLNRVLRLIDIIRTIIAGRKRFDVLILEVYSGQSMIVADVAGFLCKMFSIPSIFVLHGGNLPDFIRRFPRWTKRVLGRADVIAAPSPYLAKEIGAFGYEIHVVPNVIDIDAYPNRLRKRPEPRLIWMRSFHEVYNPLLALRAFAILKRSRAGATLVMAGVDKGLESAVKQFVSEHGLSGAVRFPGFLDASAKAREFSAADIYLNTNRIDNMPVSVVEACAMGLPVVATNVGGLPDLISNRENGLLVADDDADAMANAVSELLDDPGLAERISRNARLLAERSSWGSVRLLWEELIANAAAAKTRTAEREQEFVKAVPERNV